MNVLILGGTGLISSGITRACLSLGYSVTHFNRGNQPAPVGIATIVGDRYRLPDLERAAALQPDVVIDMLGFTAHDAELVVQAFGGKTRQLIFCSTCCVYDLVNGRAPFREDSPLGSHWHYGLNKQRCEEVYLAAHASGAFACTIFRPSHVYGEDFFIHQFGFDGALLMNRLVHQRPVLLFEGGRQLWQACHHDDASLAFAHACLRKRCYGKAYNLTYREMFSWRECYERIAEAIGTPLHAWSLGAETLPLLTDSAYEFLLNISRYSFAADSAGLYADIPEFEQKHTFESGVRAFWSRQRGDLPLEYDPLLTELLSARALWL